MSKFSAATVWQRLRRQDGVTAVEYALITALIAVAIIVALSLLGTKMSNTLNNLASHTP